MERISAKSEADMDYKMSVLEGLGFEISGNGGQSYQEDGAGNSAWQNARAHSRNAASWQD